MRLVPAALLMTAIVLIDVALMLRAPSLWMVPLALFGWYLADLASGVVHMYMDYRPSRTGVGLDTIYFYEGNRESAEYLALRAAAFGKLGPIERLTYDFKNHHPRPDALGRRSMAVQVGATMTLVTLPFAALVNALFWLSGAPPMLLAAVTTFILGTTFAQYFHGTLHRDDVPWPVRAMRRARLLMRPEDHRRHHDTLTHDFSTINGWSHTVLNAVFDALRRRGHLPDSGLTPQ